MNSEIINATPAVIEMPSESVHDSNTNANESGQSSPIVVSQNSSSDDESLDDGSQSQNSDFSDRDESISNSDEYMSTSQSLEMIGGILAILSMRLKSDNSLKTENELNDLFRNHRYVELLAFLRVLHCHYKASNEELLSESCDQIVQILDPVVTDKQLRERSDFLESSLSGVLRFFKCCFNDKNLVDRQSTNEGGNELLYTHFMTSLRDSEFFRMYGMLLGCQDQFQEPDKSLVFDIIHEHIIALCPSLD